MRIIVNYTILVIYLSRGSYCRGDEDAVEISQSSSSSGSDHENLYFSSQQSSSVFNKTLENSVKSSVNQQPPSQDYKLSSTTVNPREFENMTTQSPPRSSTSLRRDLKSRDLKRLIQELEESDYSNYGIVK